MIKKYIFLYAVSMLLAFTASAQSTVTLTSSTGAITLSDGQTLTGTGGAETHVTIANGATITLSGVTISNITEDNSHRWAGITCAGDATIILANGTTNTVVGGGWGAGIFIPNGYTLTIKGSGTLIARGYNKSAGIGANAGVNCGNIVIEDGVITATGGDHGAGIGSCEGYNSSVSTCGNITITGGSITATGGRSAAGIGSGYDYTTCGNILISGGTITAKGGYEGAGIGSGSCDYIDEQSKCGNITITGGTITSTKGEYAKNSIGVGGSKASCGTVTIGGAVGAISTSPYTITVIPATYSIIFNANGGSGSMSNQIINVNITTPLTRNSFTRDGYYFTGWSNTADGDVDYVNGQSVTDLAASDDTKTLYAKWVSKENLPAGIQVDADYLENQTGFYYVNMPINAATTTVNISDFKYFPFKIYDDGGKDKNATRSNGYLTIYPPLGYNVNLDGKVLAKKMQYNTLLTVFDGNNANASQLGKFNSSNSISVSSTGSSITIFFDIGNEDVEGLELIATTSIINYSIIYNVTDGATFATDNPTSYTVISDAFTLENPTKEGYEFVGWVIDEQTTPTKTVTFPKGSTGNKVFTTVFKKELGALTLYYYGNRITAEIQGDFINTSSEDKSLVISESKTVDKVTFKRSFTAGIPATIMLPFGFTPNKNIGSFYTLESVKYEGGEWIAKTSVAVTSVKANTPYIFKAANDLTELSFEDEDKDDDEVGITLQPTSDIKENPNGDWTLHGVYEKTMLYGNDQINYGFAGKDVKDEGISVGDFIRAGQGVWADPMRCYLTYKDGELTKAATVLPDRIRVVFPDEVEEEPSNTEIITPVTETVKETGVKVWSFNKLIIIESQPDTDYTIVDLSGRILKTGVTHSTHEEVTLGNNAGIVIVNINGKAFKVNL